MMTTMMKRSNCRFQILSLAVACSCVVTGCNNGAVDDLGKAAQDQHQKLISDSVLEGEQMVSEVRKQLAADDINHLTVVLKGRIDAGEDSSPWEDGKAAFVLTDAIGHEGETDHDPHTCPFCSRNINDYLVMVSFHDDEGNLIETDSRKLFGVKEKQMVFVSGEARINEDDGLLLLDADKLHVVK